MSRIRIIVDLDAGVYAHLDPDDRRDDIEDGIVDGLGDTTARILDLVEEGEPAWQRSSAF